MKKIAFVTLAVLGVYASVLTQAEARQGCGRGYHRSPYGNCRPNGWIFKHGYGWRQR